MSKYVGIILSRHCAIENLLPLKYFAQQRNYCTKIKNITDITKAWMTDLPKDSYFVKTLRFHYVQDGVKKDWDLINIFDGVSAIVFNIDRQKFVFVRQFRPAVYYAIVSASLKPKANEEFDIVRYPPEIGVTLELCAGMVDKNKSLEVIASEEVLEECGYEVCPQKMEHVFTYRSGIGPTSAKQTLYYCEVCDAQKKNSGGGIHTELIDVVEYSIDEAKGLTKQGTCITSPPSVIMGLIWFFCNKDKRSKF